MTRLIALLAPLLRRTKTICLTSLGALLLGPLLAYAQPEMNLPGRVKYVYRVDTRPPEQVYRDGFRSQGRMVDLIAHTTGSSCQADNDSWISTTSSLYEIGRFIGRQLGSGHLTSSAGQVNAWLYVIQLDHTFVDVEAAFVQAIAAASSNQLGYPSAHTPVLRRLVYLNEIGPRDEYVALRSIAPHRVLSASSVIHSPQTNAISFSDGTTNAAFVEPNATDAFMSRVDDSTLVDLIPPRSVFDASLSPAVRTCFQTCDNTQNSSRTERSVTSNTGSYCQAGPNRVQALISAED